MEFLFLVVLHAWVKRGKSDVEGLISGGGKTF